MTKIETGVHSASLMCSPSVEDPEAKAGHLPDELREATPARPRLGACSISVVIPVYNSEQILPELTERLVGVLSAMECAYEIILVNDASRDRSWERIRQLSVRYPQVRGLNLLRNYGQHNALLCGIREALHDFIVTMDDDLQHPPEEIPALLRELLRASADVAYGTPLHEQHGIWRNLASRSTKVAMEYCIGAANARNISSFRLFRAHLRSGFATFQSPFVSIDVLLTWSTRNTVAVRVRRDPRKNGRSNYSTWKLVTGTLNVITAFSTLPLRIATIIGLATALFGVGVLAYVLGTYLLHGSVPGFPFLACLIAIFSGTQLIALGIIGEYLGRIFLRSVGQPIYTIKEVVGSPRKTCEGNISTNGTSHP